MCSRVNSPGEVSDGWYFALARRSRSCWLCQPTPALTASAVLSGWQKGALVLILRGILVAQRELWTFKVFADPLNSDFWDPS